MLLEKELTSTRRVCNTTLTTIHVNIICLSIYLSTHLSIYLNAANVNAANFNVINVKVDVNASTANVNLGMQC